MLTMTPFALFIPVVAAVVALVALKRTWRTRLQRRAFPPGPRGWPIIGSALDIPVEKPWEVYREWSRLYGDIVFFEALGTPMLVISSPRVAFDLMDKRSALYSDRPQMVMTNLTGWDVNLGLMPHSPRWRAVRRVFHQYFNQNASQQYHTKQTKHIHAFLLRCLEQAGNQFDPLFIRQMLAGVIVDVVYGLQIRSMDDEYTKLATRAVDAFNESQLVGKYWAEFIPVLKYVPPWVPGAAAAKIGALSRPLVKELFDRPFSQVKKGLETARDESITRDLLTKIDEEEDPMIRGEKEKHAKEATGIAYIAASDTTYSLVLTFLCCMAMHPDVQKKAREEMDAVIGPLRLPTFDDCESLPYIKATFMECFRWLPVLPLIIPHRLIADDYYNGYFIPEGTVVIANVWHMLRDPQEYPDPERFNPDRYMEDGALNPKIRDPSTMTFGFGRRICPGRYFAQDTALLTFASVLHLFDVLPSLDDNGKERDPTPNMTTGVLSYPDSLNVMLKPRSDATEKLIRAAVL